MVDKFYEQARVSFLKLSPKKGDTIAISFPADMSMLQIHSTMTYLQQLAEEFNCNVMVLGQGVEVSILSEEEMAEYGWYRIPEELPLQ